MLLNLPLTLVRALKDGDWFLWSNGDLFAYNKEERIGSCNVSEAEGNGHG